MGWLRFVGSFKLQVSFAKETYKRDDILPKRPMSFKEPTNRSHPISHMNERVVSHVDRIMYERVIPHVNERVISHMHARVM